MPSLKSGSCCCCCYYCVWRVFFFPPVPEVLGQPLCEHFHKSMNKERKEAVPKFCVMAGSIFAEKSDSLQWYSGFIKQNNILKCTTRRNLNKKPAPLWCPNTLELQSAILIPVRREWQRIRPGWLCLLSGRLCCPIPLHLTLFICTLRQDGI